MTTAGGCVAGSGDNCQSLSACAAGGWLSCVAGYGGGDMGIYYYYHNYYSNN